MKNEQRMTRRDVLASICCTSILFACTGAIGHAGREQAKRAVCMANLCHLTAAWNEYADDHHGEIISGDAGEYAAGPTKGPYWVSKDWVLGMTQQVKETAIQEGALFGYVRDIRVYRCPLASPEETRSYSIVDSMNVTSWQPPMQAVTQRSRIKYPAERCVFIDDRGTVGNAWGGWTIRSDVSVWWDPPPVRHAGGATLSFVDGHTEYLKWKDPRTVQFGDTGKSLSPVQAGNPDIQRCQLAVWGVGLPDALH